MVTLESLLEEEKLLEQKRLDDSKNSSLDAIGLYKRRMGLKAMTPDENKWAEKSVHYLAEKHGDKAIVKNIVELYEGLRASNGREFYNKLLNVLQAINEVNETSD